MRIHLIFVTLALVGGAAQADEKTLKERVLLEVAADRTSYYPKEPVLLTVAFKNVSKDPVLGQFFTSCELSVSDCKLKIFYRRSGGAFARFVPIRDEMRAGWLLPDRIKPGETKQAVNTVLFDWKERRFVLEQPGSYELKAVHAEDDAARRLESNVVTVEVERAPADEQEAATLFENEDLIRFVQEGWYRSEGQMRERALKVGGSLIEKHPQSRYASHIRRYVFDALSEKVATRKASDEEKELHHRLEEEVRQDATWKQGVTYQPGDRVVYNGNNWKCIKGHRAQSDWPPPLTASLWVKLPEGDDWDQPVQYVVGDEVTYHGATYTCRQAHTSQAGWMPPNTPALWSRK
jgi:hypothetical protein